MYHGKGMLYESLLLGIQYGKRAYHGEKDVKLVELGIRKLSSSAIRPSTKMVKQSHYRPGVAQRVPGS